MPLMVTHACEHGFRQLIKDAYLQYTVPSRTTLSRNVVLSLFQPTKQQLKMEISDDMRKNVQSFSLTTDFWNSRANESSVSVTGHYVTNTFQMKSKLLNCSHMIESHTAENIKDTFTIYTASEWKQIDGLVKVLEPIAQATEETSFERYQTLGLVIPLFQGIRCSVKSCFSNKITE
ncbi:hypothetical protein PR048_014067 [Dryococelus australis]|uniref:Uncharacterized protein n=1 Tax=Dryococelus australis TaxID=614101 RepID=A0ABQ9HTZ2_9NEOP|nr:hypothetical protein PR048_014067 [Dryococelus australis]